MSGIVIIEEDVLMRSLLREWLTAGGYRVNGGGDLPAGGELPGLVIADVYMPRHQGVDRLRAARAVYPGVPIIAISAQFRAGVRCAGSAAQTLGVEGVIAKPFGREVLLHAVRSVIGPPVDNAE
jgi:DNA-binding response OmpR family regulator